MNIFGYGGKPQEKKYNSGWTVDGQDLDEYKASHPDENVPELTKRYWQLRDEAVNKTGEEVLAMHNAQDISLYNANVQDAAAISQVQDAATQWERLERITSGKPIGDSGTIGGTVIGYDLETFGDTRYGNTGEFGITEFGIGKTTFREGGLFKQEGHSLAIGLNKEQADYVTSILDKYKTEGWTSLSQSEQVTMQRMSMYAGNGTNFRNVFKQITEEGDFKGLWEVQNLRKADMSPELIERGIKNLQSVYNQGATDSVIDTALQYLIKERGVGQSGGVLTGANTSFDITTLERYTGGSQTSILNKISRDTVDLVYGTRTAAAARAISVSEYQNIMHGTRGGGASVQSLLLSLGLNETETHLSISDINQQIQLLASRDFANGKTLGGDLSSFFQKTKKGRHVVTDSKGGAVLKRYDSKNTLFLLNRGWLDKRNGQDIALLDINGKLQATQNYTISGEYWELDPTHTGIVDEGYRLSMVSSADGTIVSKIFGTQDQAVSFLRENADWYDRNEIINSSGVHQDVHIEDQIRYKYYDKGRREFERAIDPASVAVDSGKASGGFATMEDFLSWDKQYGGKYSATPEGFKSFVKDVSETETGFKINQANSMQSFLGAQEKIADERGLLSAIADKVNAEYGPTTAVNNLQKTIAFRKAYEDAISSMSSRGRIQHLKSNQNLIISDIFAVDIKTPQGGISRINTHTVSSATKDINRIFSGMSKEEAVEVIADLGSRHVLSDSQTRNFTDLIKKISVDAGGDTAKKAAIERYLDSESSYQLYTDIGYALYNRTKQFTQTSSEDTAKSFSKKRSAKAKQAAAVDKPQLTLVEGPARENGSLSGRMQEYIHSRYVSPGKSAKSITQLLEDDSAFAEEISNGINKSIQGLPSVHMYGTDRQKFKEQLKTLSDSLNYGEDIITESKYGDKTFKHNILEEMFFADREYAIGRKQGIHSVIVRPDDKGSAFVLLTNDNNYGRMMEELSRAQASDIATYKGISGSGLKQYAAIYELPSIERKTIDPNISQAIKDLTGRDAAELTVLKQSENSSKFLINQLNIWNDTANGGKVKAYVNNGVYDYLSSWRMGGKTALDKIAEGSFEDATRYLRRQQNEKLKELSSSASYRGYWDESLGKIVRRTNYTPGDYLYAYRMRMTEGLSELFSAGLSNNAEGQANGLDVLADAYGRHFNITRTKDMSNQAYRQSVAGTTSFKEFFAKNLFLGTLEDDSIVGGISSVKDKSIFTLIQETVNRDSAGIFDDSVRDVLNKIAAVNEEHNIFQVLSNTAMEKGDVSLGVAAGEFNVNGFLYSTMRPTYLQQNLGRLFSTSGAEADWSDTLYGLNSVAHAGSPELTIKEFTGLHAFDETYASQSRHVMGGFRQMSDFALQSRYNYLAENVSTLSKEIGISEYEYSKVLQYMREDMISLNEGKWFMDPRIGEQNLVKQSDAKKIKLINTKNIDAQRTGETLQSLIDNKVKLTSNTIVGYDNRGKELYFGDNVKGHLDDFNIKDIFDVEIELNGDTTYTLKKNATGFTKIIPDIPDIIDSKVMFNGAEKATAHAIAITPFMEYMGGKYADKEYAMTVLAKMFQQVSEGAAFIGNMNVEKHGNLMALDSIWRTITDTYVQQGQGDLLVEYLNKNIANNVETFGNIRFQFIDGQIMSDTSKVANPSLFILRVFDDIKSDINENTKTNQLIINRLAEYNERNISFGAFEFMYQNEHVSDGISMDKRIEQGIRQRALAVKEGKAWDQDWADELVSYSEKYNARRTQKSSQYENINKVFDFINTKINVKKIEGQSKRRNMEKSLHGIVESLIYYEDPSAINISSKNIISLDFQKLMNAGIVPKNGVSVDSLQSTLFFTNGKPSEALSKLAKEQGLPNGWDAYSNSLYVDLGEYSIKSKNGKQDLHGFLLPIQNTITDADETMFQAQQSNTSKMLSRLQNIINNPGKKTTQDINREISSIVRDFYQESMRQLAVADKDSDYYKTIQRHFMPNSGGMLAQQEIAPLMELPEVDASGNKIQENIDLNNKFRKAIETRDSLEKSIINANITGKAVTKESIENLDSVYEEIASINKSFAERIRSGEVLNFTQLKGTNLEGITKELINGKEVYGYVAATSKKAFEDAGVNFGQFGMDILSDIEKGNKNIPESFRNSADFIKLRSEIFEAVKGLNLEGLDIQHEDNMMSVINDWIGSNYAKFNTKEINEAIAANGPLHRLINAFDEVGVKYMKEVGLYGEFLRYPTFRSQLPAKWILSDHIIGNEAIIFNPVASSITNVDFDGDLVYSIFHLNGASGMLSVNNNARMSYESNLQHIPELLAKLVEGGDAISASNINNYTSQMASILKKMDRDKYEEVRQNYIKANHLGTLTEAEEYAFKSSKEIQQAFIDFSYNTLFDIQSQKASIAPVLRKENIGYISTTNFTIRNMMRAMASHYEEIGDTDSYNKILGIIEANTSMGSKAGGLMDMAEQSGIDTKHVWDAMTTAETARYSLGMNLLFGNKSLMKKGEQLEIKQTAAVENIVSSLYNNVFKDTNSEMITNRQKNIQSIVSEIMAHKSDWQTYDFGGKDVAAKRGISALLSLQEMDKDADFSNLRRWFTNAFNKGYDSTFSSSEWMMEDVSDLMKMYIDAHGAETYHGKTFYDGLTKFILSSFSHDSLQTTENISYVIPSSLRSMQSSTVSDDLIFSLKDASYNKRKFTASFDIHRVNRKGTNITSQGIDLSNIPGVNGKSISIKDNTLVFTANSTQEMNSMLFGDNGYFSKAIRMDSIAVINNNMNAKAKALDEIRAFKISSSINDIILGQKGNVNSAITIENNINYIRNLSSENQAKFGQEVYDLVHQLFVRNDANVSEISRKVNELASVYEYARADRTIGKAMSLNDLLVSINNDIANHPERYKTSTDGTFKTFDEIFQDALIDKHIFTSVEQIQSISKSMIAQGDFDYETYNKTIQHLTESIYDVHKETSTLSDRYVQFAKSNLYANTEIGKATLSNQQEAIGNFTNALNAFNQKQIDEAQESIYKLFKNRQQMDAVFGWNDTTPVYYQKVGFGKHIGQKFDTLTTSEVYSVFMEAEAISSVGSDEIKYAAEQTSSRLGNFMKSPHVTNKSSAMQYRDDASPLLESAMKEVDKLQKDAKIELERAAESTEDAVKETVENATKNATDSAAQASSKTTRNTLSGHIIGQFKDFTSEMGITKKHVGIVVAGLAALGVTNNLLHNQKTSSPLSPARKPNGSSPTIDGYYPDSPQQEQAPASAGTGQRTVYHDQQSGLNFRVSASTSRNNNARQQAAQINSITGGNTNISVQQDTSRVTDNWLSNKFADLI